MGRPKHRSASAVLVRGTTRRKQATSLPELDSVTPPPPRIRSKTVGGVAFAFAPDFPTTCGTDRAGCSHERDTASLPPLRRQGPTTRTTDSHAAHGGRGLTRPIYVVLALDDSARSEDGLAAALHGRRFVLHRAAPLRPAALD